MKTKDCNDCEITVPEKLLREWKKQLCSAVEPEVIFCKNSAIMLERAYEKRGRIIDSILDSIETNFPLIK